MKKDKIRFTGIFSLFNQFQEGGLKNIFAKNPAQKAIATIILIILISCGLVFMFLKFAEYSWISSNLASSLIIVLTLVTIVIIIRLINFIKNEFFMRI